VGADGIREKDGKKLELKYGTTTKSIRQDTQAVVQQNLKDVGIQVDLSNYESDTFFNGFDKQGPAATGQLDMYEFSQVSTAFPDPDIAEWLCSEIPTADSPAGTKLECSVRPGPGCALQARSYPDRFRYPPADLL